MSNPKDILGGVPTVHYFDLGSKGRGEPIRLFFEDAGVKFVDRRIPFSEWPKVKQEYINSGINPVGSIPVVELSGRVYTQSIPTLRYFSKKLGYIGRNAEDEYFLDRLADVAIDWRTTWGRLFEKNEEYQKKHTETNTPKFLRAFESFYGERAGDFVLGNEISYVDFLVYQMIDDEEVKSQLKDYPNLHRLCNAVERRPNVAAYLASPRRNGGK